MKKKILVVDDSEVVRCIAREALEKRGFDVVTACNGIEANHYLFGQDQADVIVLDVMMPVLQGDKIAKFIKHNKYINNIPILLISSRTEIDLQRMVIESGADGFLQKPFTDEVLVEKVEEVMRSRPKITV